MLSRHQNKGVHALYVTAGKDLRREMTGYKVFNNEPAERKRGNGSGAVSPAMRVDRRDADEAGV